MNVWALRAHTGKELGQFIVGQGTGGNIAEGSRSEHTFPAVLEYTLLLLVSVAVPSMESPPP